MRRAGQGRAGIRRGLILDLEQSLARGADGIVDFAFRHSIPEPNTGCWLWLGPAQGGGYGYVVDPRKPFNRASAPRAPIHRIVCETVHRPMLDEEQARHLCHQPGCVNPDHLAPGTPSQNMMDSVRSGRFAFTRGEGNGRAKITAAEAATIRSTYIPWLSIKGRHQAAEVGASYGISESMVRKIVRGENWIGGF